MSNKGSAKSSPLLMIWTAQVRIKQTAKSVLLKNVSWKYVPSIPVFGKEDLLEELRC